MELVNISLCTCYIKLHWETIHNILRNPENITLKEKQLALKI